MNTTTAIPTKTLLDRVAKNGHCPKHRKEHLKRALSRLLEEGGALEKFLETLAANLFFAVLKANERTQMTPALVSLFKAYKKVFGELDREAMRIMLVQYLNHADRMEINDPKGAIKGSKLAEEEKELALEVLEGILTD